MANTLPLDRRKAIDKMLKPHKPRRQEAVVCQCGVVRMVNTGTRKPALCRKCADAVNKFNGGHGKP